MALLVTVRNGGDAGSTTVDITNRLRTDEDSGLSLGNRAYDGESSQSVLTVDDDNAEYGNSSGLPGGLTMLSIAAHNPVTVTETATAPDTVLVRGRVIPKDIGRADLGNMGRGRQVILKLDDYNADLKGNAFLTDQERPAETDVARATWVYGTFLSGSPRFTTNLTNGIVATPTVDMPAKTYEAGTQPLEVMQDCATAAEKTFFIMANGTFYYATLTDTSQLAGLRISDRLGELNTEGTCPPAAFAGVGSLGGAASINGDNELSQVVPGPRAEVVDLVLAQNAAVGQCIVCIVGHSHNADPANAIWDDAGNTYTLAAEHRKSISGDQPRVLIYYSNLTAALAVGQKIRWEVDVGSSILGTDETDGRVISAYLFDGALSVPVESGNGSGFTASPSVAVGGSTGLLVAGLITKAGDTDTITDDPDWTSFTRTIGTFALSYSQLAGGFRINDAGGETWSGTISQTRDWAMVGAYFTTGSLADGTGLPTFPPIWLGPASTEDGQELLSGGVLRHTDGFVSETRPSVVSEYDYWVDAIHDTGAVSAADATSRLSAMLNVHQYEDRTYSVAVQLERSQVCMLMAGQMIWIKARAIPDADDAYVQRRVASLEWQMLGPEHYLAVMELDKPWKTGRRNPGSGIASQALLAAHKADPDRGHWEQLYTGGASSEAIFTSDGDPIYVFVET